MRIGLIDVERYNDPSKKFPNIPLMKISAYYKSRGDYVSWYDGSYFDLVYISKIFSFSKDLDYDQINAKQIIKGGSGFAISLIDGKEVYNRDLDQPLADYFDKQYPDYELYEITDTAYGFISKGCPRGCFFCHVKNMQGVKPYRVARLNDFWRGQKKHSAFRSQYNSFL